MNSFQEVPQELKALHNWVVRNSSKIPFNPNDTHSGAKANDPSTWGSYDEAVDAATLEGFSGIGFEFGGTDVDGIDFDNVLADGKPEDYVVEILEQLGNPYCEISPSGTGLHAFVECPKLPGTKRKFSNGKHYGAEIYSGREKGRYFTITGQRFSGEGVPKLENIDIPYLLLSQIHDVKFKKLWLGDASDYGEDQSRADLALAWRLAQQLDRNAALVEQAFNASKPGQREKWTSRQDYRDRTLTLACASKTEPKSGERDFNESGNSPPDAPQPTRRLVSASSIKPKKITWLWENRVPMGKITLFAGNPDNGKSLAGNSLAAKVTTGEPFADSPNVIAPSDVLMLLGEDDLDDTAVPRLRAANANLSRIYFPDVETDDAGEIHLDQHLSVIEQWLNENPNIRLVVIDPISNYLGKVSMVAEQEVRSILVPLRRLAARKNVAVVLIMHLNKKSELDAISRVGGAMAFTGVARSSWLFQRDASTDEGELKDTFTMSRIKNNLAKASGGLSYRIESMRYFVEGDPEPAWAPVVIWGDAVQRSANDVLKPTVKQRGRPATQRVEAAQWLRDYLRDGAKTLEDIRHAGKQEHGFSPKIIDAARKDAGVRTFVSGEGKARDGKMRAVYSCNLPIGEGTDGEASNDLVTVAD
jgi:AAA domain